MCLELKNIIKSRRALRSAYCQVSHRTTLFKVQYNPTKMGNIYQNCFARSVSYRVKESTSLSRQFNFPEKAIVIPVLEKVEIPVPSTEMIGGWNKMVWETFIFELYKNTKNKEINRMIDLAKRIDSAEITSIE